MNMLNSKIQVKQCGSYIFPHASSKEQHRPKTTLDLVLLGIPEMEYAGSKILMAGGNSLAELLLGRKALEENVASRTCRRLLWVHF